MTPLLVALALAVAPSPGPRQITMTGEARVAFKPNRVTATFSLNTTHRNDAGARAALEEKTQALIKACLAAGVAPQDLVPSPINSSPQYRGNEITGSLAARSLAITVTDMARVDEALTAAVRSGGTLVTGVTLTHTDRIRLEDEARTAAAKDARSRAENVLGALGARVGLPISVTDRTPTVAAINAGGFVVPAQGSVTTGFGAQELSLTAQVTVLFDIEPPK